MNTNLITIEGIKYLIVSNVPVMEALFGKFKLYALNLNEETTALIVYKEHIAFVVDNGFLVGVDTRELDEYMLDVLEDTVKYYSVAPNVRRCEEKGRCYYSPSFERKTESESEGCAVGRLLPRAKAQEIDTLMQGITSAIGLVSSFLPHLLTDLPAVYIVTEFFENLQKLHDRPEYWNDEGLTSEGNIYVDLMKRNIKDGVYYDNTGT